MIDSTGVHLMVSIVSFHSNKHVNAAAYQFDAVGLIGYIEGSTVQKKLLSSAEYRIQNTEYERHSAAINIVQKNTENQYTIDALG